MKKKNIKISVIIPTLNRKKFICRAIDSVRNQSHKVDEIIIVDNNSTDKTIELIKKKYTDILIVLQKKRGVSVARNQGVYISKYNWIAFLDSDDEWEQKKIEEQVNFINTNKNEINFVHTDELWFRNNIFLNQKIKHKKKGGYIFSDCLDICKISPSTSLIKKNLLIKYGCFNESFRVCEDYELWLRITSKERVGYVDKPLVKKFGGHSDQLSKRHWGLDRFRIKALENLITNFPLSYSQKKKVIHKILEKIDILIAGAEKRNKDSFKKSYSCKKEYWEKKLINNYGR